jgi:hypothetical protein
LFAIQLNFRFPENRTMRTRTCLNALTAIAVSIVALSPVPTNAAAIHSGLLSYWTLDGNGSDTASSLSGSTGTVADTVTAGGTASAAQIVGTGGLFGGSGLFERTTATDGRLAATNSADLDRGGADISISLWAQYDNNDVAWMAMISKGEGSNYRVAVSSLSGSTGSEAAYAGGTGDIDGTTNVQDTNWHHIVATTTNGGGVALYVNGALEATGPGPATLATSTNALWIGNNPQQSARMWDGRVDDVAIWDRVLDADDVSLIHSQGLLGNSLGAITIPEPSTLALASLGLLGLIGYGRRRKR